MHEALRPVVSFFLVLFLTLAGDARAAKVAIVLDPLAVGLSRPVAIAHAHDGSGRLFIAEQRGKIKIWDGTQMLAQPFLDLGTLVSQAGNEQGLLGLAFHPDYASNGLFYVNYTADPAGNTVIARYSVLAGDPNQADPASAFTLLGLAQPFGNHNGGELQFGPDGYLYIGLGDGGSGGDPDDRAQDLGDLLGKLLRIDVDGGSPYAIPPTNPFVGTAGARDEIWAYGLRNPWRFSFDRLTGALFIGDVGQNNREEVDFQPAGSPGGENYGWRCMEGTVPFNTAGCPPAASLTPPVAEYAHTGGNCSITGGYRYRGTTYSQLFGVYVYGDFCTGLIWGLTEQGGVWSSMQLADTAGFSLSSFGEDELGELYSVGLDGSLNRVVALPGCADGLDNDDDGFTDFSQDPGCGSASSVRENPQCQDGVDNDGATGTDFDGGVSVLGAGNGDPAGPDPDCVGRPFRDNEKPGKCGLGFELGLLMPALLAWRRRPSRLRSPVADSGSAS